MYKIMSKKIVILLVTVILINSFFIMNSYANDNKFDKKESIINLNNKEKNSLINLKENEIIVKFKNDLTEKEKQEKIDNVNGKTIDKNENTELIEVDENNLDELVEILNKDSEIDYAQFNYTRELNYIPNDELLEEQWSIDNINCSEAWDIMQEEENLEKVKVAVIDTGVDMNHEDLEGVFTDDGYDFCDDDKDPSAGLNEYHATHVSGIIAAKCNNDIGVSGIAGNTPIEIMALRALSSGGGDDYTISKAIYYAVDNGAKIINMSFGGVGTSKIIEESIEYAIKNDVILVAAAGNSSMDTKYYFPAGVPGVITVAASDINNNPASFTNYGEQVDLIAPGVDIINTYNDNKYINLSGTSMAAPTVCGVTAMIKSKYPDYNSSEIQDLLYNSTSDLGEKGKDKIYGYGLIDAKLAVSNELSTDKLKFVDLTDGHEDYYETNFYVNYTEPENLSSMNFYLDDEKIDSKYSQNNTLYSISVDLRNFEDGEHSLKVEAIDTNRNKYVDELNINVKNDAGNDLRIKVLTSKERLINTESFIMEKDSVNDFYEVTSYYYVDRKGYINIPEDMIKNKNDFIFGLTSMEMTDNGLNIYNYINSMKNTGEYTVDNNKLEEIKFEETDIDNYLTLAKYKVNDDYINSPLICDIKLSELTFDINNVYISPGEYEFIQRGSQISDEKSDEYLLKSTNKISNYNTNEIKFDKEKVSNVNVNCNDISDWKTYYSETYFEEIDSIYSLYVLNPTNEKNYYVTPGIYDIKTMFYSYFIDEVDNIKMLKIQCENETKKFYKDEYDLNYGGEISANIRTNKKVYNEGDIVKIKFNLKDSFNNKIKNASLKISSLENDYLTYSKLKDRYGNLIENDYNYMTDDYTFKIPNNLKGIYNLFIGMKYPNELEKKIFVKIK